jgi:uncharacterized protein YecE (DUF72 family)
VGNVRVGTASWTERTLLESRAFYPPTVRTPEQRLRWYARHFSFVEVDASYYALPSPRNAAAWVERTPGDFVFGVKAYAALTRHPFEPSRLDRGLQGELPAAQRSQRHLYAGDLPAPLLDEIWERFRQGIAPLSAARRLGYVLFQMPPWFGPSRAHRAYLDEVRGRMPAYPLAVEFRHAAWLEARTRERTLDLLRAHGMAYVCVDEPQGTPASVPPVAVTTSPALAVVRFHGRRVETWRQPAIGPSERFHYRYTGAELGEWVPRIRALAAESNAVHVAMNNCHRSDAVDNARDLLRLLAETP